MTRRLLELTHPARGRLLLASLLGAATVGAGIGLMSVSGWLISTAALQPPVLELSVAIVAVRFFGLARAALRYVERLVSHDLALRLLADLRCWLYERLEPLLPAGLGSLPSGELLQRLVADADALQEFFIRVVTPPMVAAASLLLTLALLAPSGPAAVAAAGIPFLAAAGGLPLLTYRLGAKPSVEAAGIRSRLAGTVVEVIAGAPELAVLGAGSEATGGVRVLDSDLARLTRRLVALPSALDALVTLLTGVTAAGVLAAGAAAVQSGHLSGPMLAAIALAALALFEAAQPMPAAAHHLRKSLASAGRLFEVADTPVPIADPPEPRRPVCGELRLENAWLHYAEGLPWALRGATLTLAPGRRVALLGPSGSGKSTVANLLAGFRRPQRGRVTLNGYDLDEYAQDDIRRLVCLCAQDAHVFNTTVRENIRLARPGAKQVELEAAARRVSLLSWIESLPNGWDTIVGEDGGLVSGGQRQRIAVARGLLAGARYLILDEPAAHLDADIAHRLMEDVLASTSGRGLLLITHRPEGLSAMDEVLEIRDGRVG